MKRIIAVILALSALMLVSCTKNAEVNEEINEENSKVYVKAKKAEVSEEERALLDEYYEKMKAEYPSFAEIDREMLYEYVSKYDDFTEVHFIFCFGGVPTGCECSFSISPNYPEGKWDLQENEFKRFYKSPIDKKTMSEIKSVVADGIEKYINENKLDNSEFDRDDIGISWQTEDGKIYAVTEFIANVTDATIKQYGCGDHAHIFAKVLLEETDGGFTYYAETVTGN